MKFNKLLIFILIVFLKTETVFSNNNLFSVNNIELEKKAKVTNKALADQAIKKGFDQLITKILLKEDKNKLSDIKFSTIKQLVAYYQISNIIDKKNKEENVSFNITFDKAKIHRMFFNKGISYSEISNKELYVLPILMNNNEIFIFNNNFFYDYWNKFYENDLIEFILPLENIEIIKNINLSRNNLINLDLQILFEEYSNKNLAFVLIEKKSNLGKIYLKTLIQGKNISKSLIFKKNNLEEVKFNEKIINETKIELINLVKSRNLIDIRTPSFINAKLNLNKKNNLVKLNSRIENIDLIENIYVQEFNKDSMKLRIKYLGKLDKIINQLKKENINLSLIRDQWIINTL